MRWYYPELFLINMSTYEERKAERAKRYNNKKGLNQRTCSACNGSGKYDIKGSPPCDACNGTGKELRRG